MSELQKVIVPVKGMHCASCSMTIEKTLKKVEGVEKCEVNYGNEKAKIEFDPEKTSLQELSKKIEPFGYSLLTQEILKSKSKILNNNQNTNPNHQTHVMPDGTMMMNHEGMDHSEHLGLNQTKEEKLAELKDQQTKVRVIMPLTLIVFFFMLWQIAASANSTIPKFFLGDEIYNP